MLPLPSADSKDMVVHSPAPPRLRLSSRGFSLLEIVVVILIAMVLSAITVPSLLQTIERYRFRSAVISLTGAIQSTRFQCIMRGYPMRIDLDKTTNSFRVYQKPLGAPAFVPIGAAVPLGRIDLQDQTALEFSPNGKVTATQGTLILVVTYGNESKTVTVSPFGNITVYP